MSNFDMFRDPVIGEPKPIEDPTKLVVRLTTSAWHDRNGIHFKQSLRFLKRKSTGVNFLEDDATNIGDLDVVSRIRNLGSVDDGVYEVLTCNHKYDWETGQLDDYDYHLIPLDKPPGKV